MASKDVLSKDEMDALTDNAYEEEIVIEKNGKPAGGRVLQYDFHQPAHLLKARLPALDMINERFCKLFQNGLFNLLHHMAEITSSEIEMLKYTDFINSVALDASISRAKIPELNGAFLIILDASLVYVIVDCFFGGPGRSRASTGEREFTSLEARIIEKLLTSAFKDLQNAWRPVAQLTFEYMHQERHGQLEGLGDTSEIMVRSRFKITIGDEVSEMQIVLPFSLLEPLRPLLASGVRKEHPESDDSWVRLLTDRVQETHVGISAIFAETDITLGELLSLKAGDFISLMMEEDTVVYADEIALFKGKIGVSNQAAAVRLTEWIKPENR
ncbi:MAG: flagellar motor switch protein FliM [Gammaproteobacteria bacterium]|nr:flagellar motor switch protein FliM [Gammaproteobacteria bacterium]